MKKQIILSLFCLTQLLVFAEVPAGKGYTLLYNEEFKGDILNTND